MGKACRDPQHEVICSAKLNAHMLAIGCRTLANIYSHIQNLTLYHAYQLALRMRWQLVVQSAQYALFRTGMVILNKWSRDWQSQFFQLGMKALFVEAFHKPATFILEYLRLNDDYIGNGCLDH